MEDRDMSNKVKFGGGGQGFPVVENEDGESDARMCMTSEPEEEEEEEAAVQPTPVKLAHEHLDAISKFVGNQTDDQLKEHKIDRVHAGIIRELSSRKAKGKGFVFSDGNREMLKLVYDRLKKAKKI
jgi:hypothetical protein